MNLQIQNTFIRCYPLALTENDHLNHSFESLIAYMLRTQLSDGFCTTSTYFKSPFSLLPSRNTESPTIRDNLENRERLEVVVVERGKALVQVHCLPLSSPLLHNRPLRPVCNWPRVPPQWGPELAKANHKIGGGSWAVECFPAAERLRVPDDLHRSVDARGCYPED